MAQISNPSKKKKKKRIHLPVQVSIPGLGRSGEKMALTPVFLPGEIPWTGGPVKIQQSVGVRKSQTNID